MEVVKKVVKVMLGERAKKTVKKYKKSIRMAMIAIVIAIVSIMLVYNKRNIVNNGNLSGVVVKEGIIPGYTKEQIEEILQRKADESMFSFEINSRPIFKDGKSEGNLRIANPPYNAYMIDVEIKLDSNNKTVFKSNRLNPNQYIENAKLTRDLREGSYEATAIINAYDKETGVEKGKSIARIIINVES